MVIFFFSNRLVAPACEHYEAGTTFFSRSCRRLIRGVLKTKQKLACERNVAVRIRPSVSVNTKQGFSHALSSMAADETSVYQQGHAGSSSVSLTSFTLLVHLQTVLTSTSTFLYTAVILR